MPSTVALHAAIYRCGELLKHWVLFVEGNEDHQKIVITCIGLEGNLHVEITGVNVREHTNLDELVYLCDIDDSKLNLLLKTTRAIPVCTDIPGWNSQDFILILLNTLESNTVIDREDSKYQSRRKALDEKHQARHWLEANPVNCD